jgi:hypothetical protein
MENPQRVTFAVRKSNKLLKSASLRICDLRNLFADGPALQTKDLVIVIGENMH